MSPDRLHLTVAAQPESLAVIRQALAGFAEAIGFEEGAIADLKTVATEACMNVVVHAYPKGNPGPLEVSASPGADELELVVRDHGVGFHPRPADGDAPSLRLGLPLIAALSDGFEILGGPGRGTEVRMTLRAARGDQDAEDEQAVAAPPESAGTVMEMPAGGFVRPVLARVISALAARADFSVDRVSDTVLIGDAVSAHDPSDFRGRTVKIELLDGGGRLELRIGPLEDGASERILRGLDLPGGASLRKLASDVAVTRDSPPPENEEAEYLVVAFER